MKKRSLAVSIILCAVTFLACAFSLIFNNTVEAEAANNSPIYWAYFNNDTTNTTGTYPAGTLLFSYDNAYTVGSVNYASSAGTGNSISRVASWHPEQGNYAPWYSYASSISQVLTIGDHEIGFSWFFGNFYNCTALSAVDLSGVALDTLCSFNYGFYNCSSLTSLDFTGFDLKYTDNLQYTFYNCSNLSTLNMSFKDMPLGQSSLTSTFENCGSLTSLDLSGANTTNVRKLPNTFKNCTSLTSLNLTGLNFSNVTDISSAFENCSSLTSLDLSTVGTNLTNANNALKGCTSLKTVTLSQSLVSKISTTGLFDSVDAWYDYNGIYTASSPMTQAGTYYDECPHNWVRQGAAADKCLGGTENYKCSICNDTKTETKTGDGHTPGAAVTCTTDQTCTVCGTVIVNKTGHSYSNDWTSDATNHWHAATCGHTNETSGIAVHTWDGGAVTKQAKCNEEGETTYTCTVCGKTKTEPIPKTSHTPETIPAEDATCTAGGKTAGEKCSVCGTVINAPQDTNALGHDWGAWVETKPATEDKEGEEKRECQRSGCNEKETRPIPKADHVHVKEADEAKEPTCTETGLTAGKHCSVCNHVIVEQTVVPAKGHTPGDAATCTTAQTCTVCGTEIQAALGHDYQAADGGVAPTCTEDGSGKVVCTRCSDEQSGDTIPALGHDWSTEWSKDETNHWHICNRCDELNDEAAHTYDWVITKEPTEDEEGEKEEYCTVCDYANGNKETLAKLVVDDNGSVGDLPKLPDNQDYDLEIAVKESESKYNIEGLNKGYLVELFIVDGEDRNPYDDSKVVTLMLLVPDGMEDFTLYRMSGDRLTEISAEEYTVSGGVVTIRTTLPSEFVFNAPAPEEPASGIPWWVWLIVGLVVVAIVGVVIVIIVVAKKKNDGNNGGDTEELKAQLAEQSEKIDELLGRDDGGFNTPVELDENGNVIFK